MNESNQKRTYDLKRRWMVLRRRRRRIWSRRKKKKMAQRVRGGRR